MKETYFELEPMSWTVKNTAFLSSSSPKKVKVLIMKIKWDKNQERKSNTKQEREERILFTTSNLAIRELRENYLFVD